MKRAYAHNNQKGGAIMPRMDKTGPEGKGSMTGRGLGKCNDIENEDRDYYRYGLGGNRGKRCFSRRFFSNDQSTTNEIETLKKRISDLESQLQKR